MFQLEFRIFVVRVCETAFIADKGRHPFAYFIFHRVWILVVIVYLLQNLRTKNYTSNFENISYFFAAKSNVPLAQINNNSHQFKGLPPSSFFKIYFSGIE